MGVPLQLILGILLALAQCSIAKRPNLRHIREAPPPPPESVQNVTEINNRDLNKIVKDNLKTEPVNPKAKFVNNIHSYDQLSLRLNKLDDHERHISAKKNSTEEVESSKEDFKKSATKLAKDKLREENSRAIDVDASKFWSPDLHSKNVFTLPRTPDMEKFDEPSDFVFEGTRHASFEANGDLTTPTTTLFDKKFKETVESVEQNIEDDNPENEETDSKSEENRDILLDVEDLKPENGSLDFVKIKTIVNNETVDKNSIHKDLDLVQNKKIYFENAFNVTKVYGEETTKREIFEHSSTEQAFSGSTTTIAPPLLTTIKSSLIKESLNENSNSHILSNNIEIETSKPVKGITTLTTPSATKRTKEDHGDIISTTSATSSEKPKFDPQSTTSTTATVPKLSLKTISDQENHVNPFYFASKTTTVDISSTQPSPTIKMINGTADIPTHNASIGFATDITTEIDITTETISSTDVPQTTIESTTSFDTSQELSDGTANPLAEEETTISVIENVTDSPNTTIEISTNTDEDTTIVAEESTTESSYEISKSQKHDIDIEPMLNISQITVENTTRGVDQRTETTVTFELGSTTLNGTKSTDNSTEKAKYTNSLNTTTKEETSTSSEEDTTIAGQVSTTESGYRTSKSLNQNIVTEQILKISERTLENTTRKVERSTESTVRNELNSTTLNDGENIESQSTKNSIEKGTDTDLTTGKDLEYTSTITNFDMKTSNRSSESAQVNVTTQKTEEPFVDAVPVNSTVNTIEKVSEVPQITTEIQTTTQEEIPTTTEYAFVHIENTTSKHTTLLPEILGSNLSYSTTITANNENRKDVLADDSSSSTKVTASSITTNNSSNTNATFTTEQPTKNDTSTTEDDSETPTDSSFSGEGGDKGKIAAIVISSVGAVCLVLLAGLLYVMKRRQKRQNYGRTCRPVGLDEYKIDNLSVYNSVRRKGGARMSKRSFGNPAFDDPVAPTHPLNFPALAKFSTNFDDIKAEYEEIPQISARTSELPDGCETKNRYANVIPLPETRVFLKPMDGYPNSDYINANYVTGPKDTKGYYIASQGPMQNTVDDFWRMVWEQQAKVILMLTHLVENGLEKCVDYLPESEVIDCSRLFGDFQIILKKQEVKDKYIISTLQLKNMVSNSWREVTHFWYLGWPEKGVPNEGNSLIAFLIEARSYMKTATIDKRDGMNGIQNGGAHNEHNPVVVHCSPGTGRTGVAIACDIAIREFETMRLVDIPKIVYRIRRDRAGAVQSKEQYMFIYKVVSLYATKLTGEALDNF